MVVFFDNDQREQSVPMAIGLLMRGKQADVTLVDNFGKIMDALTHKFKIRGRAGRSVPV